MWQYDYINMRHPYPFTPFEHNVKRLRRWLWELNEALADNPWFAFALFLDSMALLVVWFVGVM